VTSRALTYAATAVVVVSFICTGLVAALFGGGAAAGCLASAPIPSPPATTPTAGITPPQAVFPALGAWDSEQVANAAVIIQVGVRMGVPARGWTIATATAMQESNLRNSGVATDHDSLGLFQQRPSQGWGTPEQIMDRDHAASRFYTRLMATPGWQDMALTVAAQAVQKSAHPDGYAKWESDAVTLVAIVGSAIPGAHPGDLEQCLSHCSEILGNKAAGLQNPPSTVVESGRPGDPSATGVLKISNRDAAQDVRNGQSSTPSRAQDPAEPTAMLTGLSGGLARCGANVGPQGWTQPVRGPVVSGFRTPQRPGHNGVDLAVPRGTAIHAASAGTVTVVACQAIAPDGSDWGCDRDGGLQVKGCGWYVDITHPGGVITRYCHQLVRPSVTVGQHVNAGDVIGASGSSGNSTGPHLHFEIHVGDASAATAVDPEPYMRARAAALGQTT
jgi:murein DD-endopeptidase MepM/ murein hydrolase activator NlpD